MARSFIVFALTTLLPAAFMLADPTPAGTPPCDDGHEKKDRGHDMGPGRHQQSGDDAGGALARFKKRMEQMSPEERQRFQDNWKRWKQMGTGEQKDWQSRAMEERERMKKVIDDTIQKLGLKLDDDQREVFVLRYRQERRKIEEQLRQEMDAKRDVEIKDMLQRLKGEFSSPKPAPSPTATP